MDERTCKAPECNLPFYRRDYCHGHYKRWKKSGDAREHIAIGGTYDATRIDRFNAKWSADVDGCHIWHGARDQDGYGHFQYRRRPWMAHRWIFFHTYGWLPPVVMHRCDKPPCVNIDCLMAGTIELNNQDRGRKGRSADHRGVLHASAKFTAEQVQQIRAVYRRGGPLNQYQLAQIFGVSQSVISDVVNGRSYANVITPAGDG